MNENRADRLIKLKAIFILYIGNFERKLSMKTNTVIVGKTSAGKTRLLNDLIQEGLSVNGIAIEDCAEIKIPPNPFYNVVVKTVQAPMDSENE